MYKTLLNVIHLNMVAEISGVMSQNIWGHNVCEGAKRPSPRERIATERGEGVGGGCPPPTLGSFFIFRLEIVQSGAYLAYIRRKFRLDDMYYNG